MNKYIYILLLILVGFFTHFSWFTFSTFSSGDTWYWFPETVNEFYSVANQITWSTYLGFGGVVAEPYLFLFSFLRGLFARLGFFHDVSIVFLHFIPIVFFSVFGAYLFLSEIFKSKFQPFVGAIIYSTNTYFLVLQSEHLALARGYALAPLLLYAACKILKVHDRKTSIFYSLCFGVLLSFQIIFEPRIFYILFFVLLLLFLFGGFFKKKDFLISSIIISVVVLGLNSYWFFNILVTKSAIKDLVARPLFGAQYKLLLNSFSLFRATWTGSAPVPFSNYPIPFYFWVTPILVFSSFLFKEKDKLLYKHIIFWGLAGLLGIFLAKQENEPFSVIYVWLFNNFPGFSFFRDSSKFYILIALSYSVLVPYSLSKLYSYFNGKLRSLVLVIMCVVLGVFLWNTKPLITGEFRSMFIQRFIPDDYLIFKNYILKQPEYFRTMWTPVDSRWSMYLNAKPKVGTVNIIENDWKDFIGYIEYNKNISMPKKIISIYSKSFSDQLFDNSSIKYVIVPLQDIANDDDFYIYYGGKNDPNIRKWYIAELDKISWLKKIDIGTQELVVYENENFRPHVYLTKTEETIHKKVSYEVTDFIQKNPTEYKVNLNNLNQSLYINFSESFHPDWKLRAGNFNWFDVLTQKNYFLLDENHYKNDANLNSFKIDPEFIKQNYPNSYKQNPDGSIDVELTMYFKPQSYFYLGLIISITTLVCCVSYLVWFFLKSKIFFRKEKNIIK